MIIGNAHTNKVANNTMDIVKKIYRISFPLHLKCLNLRANKGSSTTIKTDRKTEDPIRKNGFRSTSEPNSNFQKAVFSKASDIINGSDAMKMVIAGVGKPINWSVCLVSMLNLASLNRANTGIIKAK